MNDRLDHKQDEAEAIPERHHAAKEASKETQGFPLGFGIQLSHHRVDKKGDGKFGADHQSGDDKSKNVYKVHGL
jgi:hypothetical protein